MSMERAGRHGEARMTNIKGPTDLSAWGTQRES